MHKHLSNSILALFLLLSLSGCRFSMNFTGGQVDTSLKTIFIDQIGNSAALVVPFVSQDLTTSLQDQFLSRSRLSLVTENPDVILSGNVTRYTVSPTAISGGDVAAQNRLSITVSVMYENTRDANQSWTASKNFTGFVDFPADADFSSQEQEFAAEAIEQIVQKVFNETLGKW
ncbi:MAG: LptE family protein [Bacteroidia bacterium]